MCDGYVTAYPSEVILQRKIIGRIVNVKSSKC